LTETEKRRNSCHSSRASRIRLFFPNPKSKI
jgi:hypothetical protein